MKELLTGFKKQTEALIDFLGYSKLEQQFGVEFDFYRYQQAKAKLQKIGFQNPSSNINGKELKQELAPFRISACEALTLHEKGQEIGHTVHYLAGSK